MTTEDQEKRFRDGYATGDHDGTIQATQGIESWMRRDTGDPWTDDGYVDGFVAAQRAVRTRERSGSAQLPVPRLTGWLHRLTASY